jgi:hypothetical protein
VTANPDAAYRRGAVLMSQRLARLERENTQLRAAVRHMARLIPGAQLAAIQSTYHLRDLVDGAA